MIVLTVILILPVSVRGHWGGKGRGLAFIDNMVKRHVEFDEFENATVVIPKTVVLCTDIFDEFMDTNSLYQVALSDADDDTILKAFSSCQVARPSGGRFLCFL